MSPSRGVSSRMLNVATRTSGAAQCDHASPSAPVIAAANARCTVERGTLPFYCSRADSGAATTTLACAVWPRISGMYIAWATAGGIA